MIRMQGASARFAAWMDGISYYDEGLFRLSKAEAVGLDPQCRILLEFTWAAMQVGPFVLNAPHCAFARVVESVSFLLRRSSESRSLFTKHRACFNWNLRWLRLE